MVSRFHQIPVESLVTLRMKLDSLPMRSSKRKQLSEDVASLYGVSVDTVRRRLSRLSNSKNQHRSDRGQPRKISKVEMESYCELIAAIKMRTTNKKGRHVSTARAIEILEESGIDTPNGLVKLPAGMLKTSTANHYLKKWGYNQDTLTRESPAARYQAEFSNDLWHFDLSTSELKHLENPPDWVEEGQPNPVLMLYSITDDRSGVGYVEYHCVYGEDTEAALRFLYNAMSAKTIAGFPSQFQGIPKKIQMDNGSISKSHIFLRVMDYLGIEVIKHKSRNADERKTAARSKSKVERPFRTIKEAHETLYHLAKPETEAEANRWLQKYLFKFNQKDHREEPHSRMDDWISSHPPEGIREMCSWEKFGTFARGKEQRKVGIDARISVYGVTYEVEPDLAGEEVTLWWGLFDDQLFVEFDDKKYGPYNPIGALSSLPPYRRFKKTKTEERADRVSALAKQLVLPRSAMDWQDYELVQHSEEVVLPDFIPFSDPDPFQQFTYPNIITAKRTIAEYLGQPIMKLPPEDREFINELLNQTLVKKIIMERVDGYFQSLSLLHSLDFQTEEKENYVN